VIRYIVRNRSLKAVRFSAPGPNGKGSVSASFTVEGPPLMRHVDLPETLADGPYGDDLAEHIAAGTLLPRAE
jgi:hypothetical protein